MKAHRPALALALVAGACLLTAPPAAAKVTCRLNRSTHLLKVTSAGGPAVRPVLRREGRRIAVHRKLPGARIRCAGSPTVRNTDRIEITVRGSAEARIQLGGGPLAPGATREPGSASEIEVTVGGSGSLRLKGGRRADHFQYLAASGADGVNLNVGPGDGDVDLSTSGRGDVELAVAGGRGDDLIDVAGQPNVEVVSFGGSGNDTLYSPQTGLFTSRLDGGRGRDRIFGGPGDDSIDPGPGRDLVEASAGADVLGVGRDGAPDRIDCGPGHDEVEPESPSGLDRDRSDRFSSCGPV